MEELEDVGRVSQFLERGDVRVAEGAVGLFDECAELGSRDLVLVDVERENLD